MTIRLPGARHLHAASGVLDQAVIALGNLGVGLLVLHLSSKTGYGLYTLAYTSIITAIGFAGALFAAPMFVAYFERPEADRHACAARTLAAQLATTALAAGAVAIAGATLLRGEARWPVVLAALACVPATGQDYVRGYLFLLRRGQAALLLDAAMIASWAAITVALVRAGGLPAHIAGLAGYALATLLTAAAGVAALRLHRPGGRAREPFAALVARGRWTLGGAAITAAQNQGHVYLAGLIASAAAVAEMNAARMLLAPMSLLVFGANRTLLPALTRARSEGRGAAAARIANRALAGMLAGIAVYAALVLLFRPLLIGAVLGGRYAGIGGLVALWAVITLLQAVDMNLSARMQSAGRFREMATVNLWTSVPVLIAVVPMILRFGVTGNLIVLTGGYAAIDLLLWRKVRGPRAARLVPVAA